MLFDACVCVCAEQLFQLKFTSKSMAREAKKCEKAAKKQRKKVAASLKKGNMDLARTYANVSPREPPPARPNAPTRAVSPARCKRGAAF